MKETQNDVGALKTVDVALIGILSAMWAVLHVNLGTLGFQLFHLPIFCDISAFVTLIIAVWIIGKFGGASAVGIIGSLIVIALQSKFLQFGFLVSAIVFDILCLTIKHNPTKRAANILGLFIITIISAYIAGAIIGVVFMADQFSMFAALTVWGGWHVVGGILSVIIALPIIGSLEKAGVRRLKSEA